MSTVISFLRTQEGFVIASDGRNTNFERKVVTDQAQKIFPIERPGIHLAYGLAGTVRIGKDESNILFNFDVEVRRVTRRVADDKPRNWWEYISAVTRDLNTSLDEARKTSNAQFVEGLETWIFLGGFYGKHQKCAHIRFLHGVSESEGEPFNHQLGFNPPFGSPRILELLNNNDPRFSQYNEPRRQSVSTLAAAIQRTRNGVQAHCDPEALKLDEEGCWAIGGRVQIATVTRADGFRWVPGFEPINPR